MPEHVSITDPQIHEPKGVATANSGYVAVANVGHVQWVDPSTIGASIVYGEAYITGNATVTTIGTGDTYQKVGTSITWTQGHEDNITWDTDHWLILTAGDYKLSASVCYTGGGTSKVYTFAFGVDSGSGITLLPHGVMRSKTSGSTDIKSIPVQAIDTFAANDKVYLLVKNETDTTGLTITDVNFVIELKEAA